MARNFILICLLFAFGSCRAYHLAHRVEQSIVDRSSYVGGWPLAAVPCPSDASVSCSTGISSQINQQCCPTGNTCFSWPATIPPVCCPSSENCVGQLQNLPVCANSTWNMYDLGQNNYFCCEQGQIGVVPTAGYAGICQAQGQAVPSSLLATLVNQVGDATANPSNSISSETGTSTNPTSITTTSAGLSSIITSSTGGSPTSSSSNTPKSPNVTHLATGAIAGIAVGGAIAIAAVILILWKCCTKKTTVPPQQASTYETAVDSSFAPGSAPVHEYKVSPVASSQQVYRPQPGVNEVSGDNRYMGRAEMQT